MRNYLRHEPMTLDRALGELTERLGASHAIVIDQSEYGLGSYHPGVPIDRVRDDAVRFYLRNVTPRRATMRRGSKLYVCQPQFTKTPRDTDPAVGETAPHIAKSFANIYVLVVWFDAPFEELDARRLIDELLPNIERLTLGEPPSGGPDVTSGAVKLRG